MTEECTKADIAKVKKWEKILNSLKTGETKYFSITSLISIKGLCHHEKIRHAYCFYLFDCIKKKIDTESSDTVNFKAKLINDIAETFAAMKNGDNVRDTLYHYQTSLFNYQSKFEKQPYKDVRIITNSDLLVVEYLISCLRANEKSYAMSVYYATKTYIEKYNPSIGTGLITDSIPYFEDVLEFWRGIVIHTKLNAVK